MNGTSFSDLQLPEERLASLSERSLRAGILKKIVFSKPSDKSLIRLQMLPILLRGSLCVQTETYRTDNKVTHENVPLDEVKTRVTELIPCFSQINLLTEKGTVEYKRSKSYHSVILGDGKLDALLSADSANGSPEKLLPRYGNDEEKEHILTGKEEFLKLLGVSDANGRIYDKKQMKFRQINRFLEMIRDVEKNLPEEEIVIYDLCCGKSYLSFAVYHYFAVLRNMKVSMYGMDLKSDVIAYCSDVASRLGFDGLRFFCGDIRTAEAVDGKRPHLVVSLHACDIATDIVLQKAIEWETPVILSTPCCHHELNRLINCDSLSFVTDYSMLRQKLCDAATDALRLKKLEANGYKTAALELVEDAPKNILLRAVKKQNLSPSHLQRAKDEYEKARAFLLGIDPKNDPDVPTSF